MKKITLFFLMLLSACFTFAQVVISENFDSGTPTGWTDSYGNTSTTACAGNSERDNIWSSSTTGNLTSPNQVGLSNGTDLSVAFDYKVIEYSGTNVARAAGWGTAELQYSTDDGTNWTALLLINDTNHVVANTCATMMATVPAATIPTASDVKLRISNVWAAGDYYFYIDNFSATQVISNPPNCDAGLTNPVNGATTAATNGNITWSAATGAPTGYNLKVGTTMGGSEVLTTTDVGNVTTYALGALAQSTMYYVNIVPYNAIGNATGCTEYNFTTFTAPANDLCANPEVLTIGTTCVNITTSTTYASEDAEELTSCDLNGNLGLWYSFIAPANGTLEYSSTTSGDGIVIYSGTCGSLTEVAGTCLNDANGSITGLTGGNSYFAMVWTDTAQATLEFCLYNITCKPVTGLAVSNITDTNAEFNWSSGNTTPETDWEYALLLATDTAPTAGTATTTNPFFTTTLTESTDYIFYVRANCGGGDFSTWEEVAFSTIAACTDASGVSVANTTATGTDISWTAGNGNDSFLVEVYADGESAAGSNTPVYTNAAATGTMEAATGLDASTAYDTFVTGNCGGTATAVQGPVSFTTACDTSTPEEVPFIETFDSPCGTITNEGSSANQWEVVAVTAYGFTPNHLRYSWDGTEAANSWYITQGINLTAGQSYDLSYDYGKAGFTEKLKVAYGTGNTSADMTTILADYPDVPGTTANNATNTFTPATTGVYHFGFQVYSDADQFYLHLDNVAVDVTPPPANDECAGAETLMVAVLANGNTTNATDSGVAAGTCGTDGGDQDIWYSFTATTAMATSGASFTTDADHVVVYSGDCTTASEIACLATGENTPVLVDGTTYLVRVYNSGLAKVAGPVEITLNEGSLSTTDFDTKSLFSYYPNPVNNTLTLNAQQAITNVAVFNMLGQEVIRTAPNAVSNSVDMAKLQSGAYFVQVTVGTSVETVRIIKK